MSYRIAKSLDTLRSQVNAAWPNRRKASDGWVGDLRHASRASDHNPRNMGAERLIVSALDITHDPASGVDAGSIAEAIKDDPRVKYVIYNRRIWNPSIKKAWRAYNGTNPHTLHVHISVRSEKVHYDSTVPWNIEAGTPVPVPFPGPVTPNRPLLKKGSKGSHVKDLQTLLLAHGFKLPRWGADGDFGNETLSAVRAFQEAKGLVVDGKVGDYTWGALEQTTPTFETLPTSELLTSAKGITHIQSFESLKLTAHQVGGIWHIGWGRSATSGKSKIVRGMKITKAQADAMFLDDLADFEDAVREAVKVKLTQGQFDALVSIAYNKGPTWFRKSTLLKAVNAQEWDRARLIILAEVPPVGHKFHNGLLRRRKAEASLFQSPPERPITKSLTGLGAASTGETSMITGWKTLIFNGGVLVMTAVLQGLAGIDWVAVVGPEWAVTVVAAVNFVLRFWTSTPWGKAA